MTRTKTSNATRMRDPNKAKYSRLDSDVRNVEDLLRWWDATKTTCR